MTMPNWKKTYRRAVAAAAGPQRGDKARTALRRFAEAHENAVTSLFAAYAEGLIDEDTFNREVSELHAAKPVSAKAATAAATAVVKTMNAALKAEQD
jgi:hypothetical protein